jgi:hypothetical protein
MATWRPIETLHITGDLQQLVRPLEYRWNNSEVWSYGLRADYLTIRGMRLNGEVRYYDEARKRPDAAEFSWNHVRLSLGAMINFGSPTTGTLHPAILRIPEVRGTR